MVTTLLGASVTKRKCPDTTTPLGPDLSLSAVLLALKTTPLNPPVMCVTNVFVLASTTSGGGGRRGPRVPRREQASGQQALVWRGHGSDDDCGGHRVPRQVSVRGADAGRRQQNDVVVVAVVPEAGDPAGIGRTGIGEGREQHHRAHE